MKLVYIFTTRVLVTYEKEFGILYFRSKGWEIEVFDMSPILMPAAYERIQTGIYAGSDLHLFYSKKEYRKYVNAMKENAVFICTDFNRLDTHFLFSCLRKEHICGLLWLGSSATIEGKEEKKLVKLDLKRVLNSIYIRLPYPLQGVPAVGFIVMSIGATHEVLKRLANKNKKTVIKYVQGNDYENYRKIKKTERLVLEKYCVFIDDYMGYHPDDKDAGIVWTQEEIDLYYTEIRDFFHFIEEKMGLKVIVALHPRADYNDHPECYEGFMTMRFRTAELIKDCEFAMTHYSDAISYTILFHKSCLFLKTTVFSKKPIISAGMSLVEKQFPFPEIDISNKNYKNLNFQDYLKTDNAFLDECIRKYYCRDYVDENTEIRPLWEQVEECIEKAVK